MLRRTRVMRHLLDEVGQNEGMQNFVHNYGYFALFFLALAESACIPIPSEVTFGFAGALCTAEVAQGKPLTLFLVILVGVIGSVVGSALAYEVGRSAGRSIVDRWGKWVLLTHKDLDAAERWFERYGAPSVLVGRVIPVVRTVISLPAGLAEMKRGKFLALTAIGCAAWVTLLTSLGYAAGSNWQHVAKYFHIAQWPILGALVVLLIFGFVHRWKSVKGSHAEQS